MLRMNRYIIPIIMSIFSLYIFIPSAYSSPTILSSIEAKDAGNKAGTTEAPAVFNKMLDNIKTYEGSSSGTITYSPDTIKNFETSNPDLTSILKNNGISVSTYLNYRDTQIQGESGKQALNDWILSLKQQTDDSCKRTAQALLDKVIEEIRDYDISANVYVSMKLSDTTELMNSNPELITILTNNGISLSTYLRYRNSKLQDGWTEEELDARIVNLQRRIDGTTYSSGSSVNVSLSSGNSGGEDDSSSGKSQSGTAYYSPSYSSAQEQGGDYYGISLDGYVEQYGLPAGFTYGNLQELGIFDETEKNITDVDEPERAGPQNNGETDNGQTETTEQTAEQTDETGDSAGQDITAENETTDEVAEPVCVPDGYFYSTERDLNGNYPCHNLARHYNSMRRMDRGFGKGWSTDYSCDLTVGTGGRVVVVTPDWKELIYEFDSSRNSYVAVKPSNFASLKQDGGIFTLEYLDGVKYRFEPAGRKGSYRLTRMEDLEGVRFVYSYGNITGFLEKVADRFGNSISFEYNDVGHITKAKDSAGREVTYGYSSLTGAVTGVKRPDGSFIKYSYDSRGNMSEKVFADGTILVTTYDNSRRVLKQFLDKKLVYEFKYNDKDNSIGYFESGRLVKNYHYNGKKCLTKIISFDNGTEEKIYNDKELVVRYIDQKGRATEFAYDDNGNIAQKVLPNGAKEAFSYDKYGRLVKYTNPLGHSTEVLYNGAGKPEKLTDADGNVTAFSYDNNNYLAVMALPDGGKISYARDDKGNALSVDNNGIVNKYEYDAFGNVKKKYSASGLVTEYAYNPDNEPVRVVKKTQTSSYEMSYEYDAFGNITKITDPLKRVTSIKWTKGFFNRMEEVTDPSGNTIKLGYDETGHLISKADRNNNGWSYTYDPLGRLTAVEDPAKSRMFARYDLAGNIISQTDFDGVRKEFDYDDLNRITAVRTEGRTDRKVEYDLAGRAVRIIDANGNATAYKYNKTGKVIETADAEGITTVYSYDKGGRLASVIDGNGNATNYAYNKLGRIESVTDPLGRKTAYFYDSAGRLSEKTLADGSKITYAYDEFGRTARITYPGDEVIYTYDAVGNVLSAKNNVTEVTRKYDALNRVIEETDSYTNKKIAYSYDPEGNRTALVLDEGYKVSYVYDALNRLSRINQGEESFKYNYTPGGKLMSKSYPNGTAQDNSYDRSGRLEKIEITGPDNKVVDFFKYTYDLAGNIVTEENPGGIKDYLYDKIDRLIGERSGVVTASYSYDPAGNRVKETTKGKEIIYTYNAANQLIRRGGAEYKYDALGNLIKDDRTEYTYNRRNLMTGARVGLSDITYKYDPFGRRIARNNTSYTYDSFSVIRESTTGFIGKRKVSYLLGARLDEILSRRASPVVYYYQDIQGSIRGLTDSSSKLIQAYDYTAFGEEELFSHQKQFLLFDRKISQPYGFTGRPKEALTGLYYYRYRDYNPQTGRFLQPDPLGQLPGPNIYSYCQNNPVNWVDPWGMCREEDDSLWYDRLKEWADTIRDSLKDEIFDDVTSTFDVIDATITASLLDIGFNILDLPSAIGHLGEGTGEYLSNPSWETAPGVLYDVSLTLSIVSLATSQLNSTYYRYLSYDSNLTYDAVGNVAEGTWVTGQQYSSMLEAQSNLQIPTTPSAVIRVDVPWSTTYVDGPGVVSGNPQYGIGGGIEYRIYPLVK